MVDRTGWWWRQLSDDADLVEEPDGTFTLTPPGPDPAVEVRADLTDAVVLAVVLAELRRRGYTITGPG